MIPSSLSLKVVVSTVKTPDCAERTFQWSVVGKYEENVLQCRYTVTTFYRRHKAIHPFPATSQASDSHSVPNKENPAHVGRDMQMTCKSPHCMPFFLLDISCSEFTSHYKENLSLQLNVTKSNCLQIGLHRLIYICTDFFNAILCHYPHYGWPHFRSQTCRLPTLL